MKKTLFIMLISLSARADFSAFYATYKGLVLSICQRYMKGDFHRAEDCAHEVFMDIYAQHGESPNLEAPQIRAISKNLAIELYRSEFTTQRRVMGDDFRYVERRRQMKPPDPLKLYDEMVRTLPPEDKELIYNFAVKEMACPQLITEQMGIRTVQRKVKSIIEALAWKLYDYREN